MLSHDEKVLEQIKKAPDIIEQSLCKNIEEQVKKSIPLFRNVQDILLLGRGFGYAVANETELKIMEASYTNANANTISARISPCNNVTLIITPPYYY